MYESIDRDGFFRVYKEMARSEINTIPRNATAIKFMYRPSLMDVVTIMNRCRNLKTIAMNESYAMSTLGEIDKICEIGKIELIKKHCIKEPKRGITNGSRDAAKL